MSRKRAAFEIVTPITVGWHLKHVILGILLTGGIWLLTGYPLCLAGRRRANRVRINDLRDFAAVPEYDTIGHRMVPGQRGAWVR